MFDSLIPLLERASGIEPDNPDIHYYLALFLARYPGKTPERNQKAIREYEKTLELKPNHKKAKEGLKEFLRVLEYLKKLDSKNSDLG